MKKNYLNYLYGVIVLGTISSCSKFGDTNINPNSATTPVTSALLTSAEISTVTESANSASNSNAQYYVQYFAQTQYPDFQLYSTTVVAWDAYYTGPLEDLQNLINVNTAKPDPIAPAGNSVNQIQIARILKAYYFSLLTDRYGDIPYFDALKGAVTTKYDKQQDIYTDLFKELKEAVSGFQTGGNPIVGDVIYGGNIIKWQKFANTLRLSLAMRLSKVDPAKGKTEFMAALNAPGGVITSNSENFQLNYPGGSFNNPYQAANLTGATDLGVSKTLTDVLNGYNDPRVKAYGVANTNGIVKGIPYGMNREHTQAWFVANADWSRILDAAWKKNNTPLVILPAAYVDLLRADAAVTYATGEDAFALLKKGIQDSWEQWKVTGDVDNYLTTIGVTPATITVAKIQEQTWLSLFLSSQFAWNEWRRTGVPALVPALDATNQSKKIPRRFQYPTTEAAVNGDAYKAAIAAFPYGGADNHDNKVWWDK